jgi:glycolate oxidase iron-sulfur subunit
MDRLSDLTAQCVRCGFCLETCPTFLISGDEVESPRGRIELAKQFQGDPDGMIEVVQAAFATCVGCRSCETACPSGVRFGDIYEAVREQTEQALPDHKKNRILGLVSRPSVFQALRMGAVCLPASWPRALSRLLTGSGSIGRALTRKFDSWDGLAEPAHGAGYIKLVSGCVMENLYPDVHSATRNLVKRAGFCVHDVKGCCGALHSHGGQQKKAVKMRDKILSGSSPVITNSAGCGSWLKDGSDSVCDLSEFLVHNHMVDKLSQAKGFGPIRLAYQDPCHLLHGQKISRQPRELLSAIKGVELVEVRDSEICCGSGGLYSLFQTSRAVALRDRKWLTLMESGCEAVVTANPGCQGWLGLTEREVPVWHLASVLEGAFAGKRPR